MVEEYIPSYRDIILLDFNPIKGSTQKAYRFAVVISNDAFNKNTDMMIVCPIMTSLKDFPTHYELKKTIKIKGSVLCEHIRSINYKDRKIKFVEKMNTEDFNKLLNLLIACLDE